MDKILTEIG